MTCPRLPLVTMKALGETAVDEGGAVAVAGVGGVEAEMVVEGVEEEAAATIVARRATCHEAAPRRRVALEWTLVVVVAVALVVLVAVVTVVLVAVVVVVVDEVEDALM
ncbi:hypothetical protein E2C01_073713 [Portunus trituberculatus]|uniref:Uncharacterized protein n=1 Tax=Portunus trituberculatus TaxID=210409 RepID=A0A5B7IE89_PORTR|nr:hypothetical protein [Portunus trituberculatus]